VFHVVQRYHWQCPRVECPPVSNDCETIEFLVYAFQYRLPSSQDGPGSDGQATVSVHCESCRYCIDRPPRTPSRSRSRSRTSRDGVDQQSNRRRRFAVLQAALGQQVRPCHSGYVPRISHLSEHHFFFSFPPFPSPLSSPIVHSPRSSLLSALHPCN